LPKVRSELTKCVDTTLMLHYSGIVIQAGRELAIGGRRTLVRSGALKQGALLSGQHLHDNNQDMHA
jgi:hypothetical protein